MRDGRSFEILNRKVSFFPDRRHFTMEGGQKQPVPDPVAGSSSAKDAPSKQVESSTDDEDVPIARQRKDLKGKIKKTSNIKATNVSKVDSVKEDDKKVPKGTDSEGGSSSANKVPKGKESEGGSSSVKKVPKGKVMEGGSSSVKKVPKGNVGGTSVNVDSGNVANDNVERNEEDDEGGDLELTAAEATQGWSLTRRRGAMKVKFSIELYFCFKCSD